LSNISYYRLRAYTFQFQLNNVENQPFQDDITFEEIIKIYDFDAKLRVLIFKAIEKIEISFRAQIVYHYAQNYGSHWQLNDHLFRDLDRYNKHVESLKKEVDRSNELFIEHYKSKYSDPIEPPSWMSFEVISFGLLSKMFQNLKKGPEKIILTRHFGLNDVSVLESWMFCFSMLRNICAHHGRVWNRRLNSIKLPTNPTYSFLSNSSIYRNKLYTTLTCIEYLLNVINQESTFKKCLKDLIYSNEYVRLKEMGFPENWQKEELWS
jgi:abortive infection bacteriophage resistance protein